MSLKHAFIHYNGDWDVADSTNYIGEDLTVVALKEYSLRELRTAVASVLNDNSGVFHIYGLPLVFAMTKTMRLSINNDSTFTYYVETFTALGPPHTPSFWVVQPRREDLVEVHTSSLKDDLTSSPSNTGAGNTPPPGPDSYAHNSLELLEKRRTEVQIQSPKDDTTTSPCNKDAVNTPLSATPAAHLCDILRDDVDQEPPEDNLSLSSFSCFIKQGASFNTKTVLLIALAVDAAHSNFVFKVEPTHKRAFVAKCVDPSCKWLLRATKVDRAYEYFVVIKVSDKHTCVSSQIKASSEGAKPHIELLAQFFNKKLRVDAVRTPNALIHEAEKIFGVELGYHQAPRVVSRGMELQRGDPDKSYYHLVGYCYMLQKLNHGTRAVVHTDNSHCFLYSFMALGVCIQAYKDSLRPTVAISRMILIGKRGGVLLIAAGVDANEQSYPLAFAIVDSENGDAYTWFLRELRKALEPEDEIVFVSDRSGAINTGVSIVFPEAEHVYCVHHISRNLAKYSEAVAQTFLNAALAYNDHDFKSNMAKLRELSSEAAEEVLDLGFASWARVKARHPRFSKMITNPAGSFYCKLQTANSLPPVLLMEFIRRTLSVWFADRRKIAEDWTGPLSELATKTINRRIQLVKNFEAYVMTRTRYKVFDTAHVGFNVVNINEKTCSCGTFQMEFLPCLHALAVIKADKCTEVVDMCGKHWTTTAWRSSYKGTIESPLTSARWELPLDIKSRRCHHPGFKPSPGRPKPDRRKGRNEKRKLPANQGRRCSKCGVTGHYCTTCNKHVDSNED